MLIGLIADTHVPEAGRELPRQVYDVFKEMDLILHAGDMHHPCVLDWLETVAPVTCARGNGDWVGRGSHPPDPRVKQVQILNLGGIRLGMVHDFPEVEANAKELGNLPIAMNHFFGGPVDVVVCGHTHKAVYFRHGNTLIVNPGSVLLPDHQRNQIGTVAILEVKGLDTSVEMIQLR